MSKPEEKSSADEHDRTAASPTNKEAAKAPPFYRVAWRYWQTKAGVVLTLIVISVMLLGPLVAPYSPTEFVATPATPPNDTATFGTDALGRDVLSRFLYGGLTVLWMSVSSAILGELLGLVIGMAAVFGGRRTDEILMRSSDIVLAFPQIVLALLFVSLAGPNLILIVVLVGVSHAPRVARLVRATAQNIMQQDYVKVAELLGVPSRRIMVTDVLPNLTTPLLVDFGLRLIWSITIIASLSFVGLGIQAPAADWGLMINENRGIMAIQPWAVLLPTLGITAFAVGANLLVEGASRAISGIDRET